MSVLKWAPGLVRFVEFDGQLATVPDYVIYRLKDRLAKIEAAGGLQLEGLKRGDRVRVIDGPMAGHEAIFDARLSGNERVKVLLEMLGRQIPATVNVNAIEKLRNG